MIKNSKKLFPKSLLNPAGFFSFKKYSIRKHFIKSIALLLVFSFSYSQLVWAVDVRQMILDAKTAFDQDTRRSGSMTPTALTTAQTAAQTTVAQQQALADLQNTNFSLTTKNGDILQYVGNTLSHVTRPDGTALRNIQVDATGNILSADLKLSDGSIQIFQNGQVIGYGTPDGSTVVYSGGQIQKVTSKAGIDTLYTFNKDASGNLIETVLDNPSYTTKYDTNNKLKEVYEKATGSRTTYSNGIIQKTVKLDGSQILYNSVVQTNGDILVTPQGSGSASTYTDAQGNIFTFTSGNVSSVKLTDGSILDTIIWDAANTVQSANLTATDGTKYVYQNKQLTMSTDATGVVTNYTYTSTNIVVKSAGNTWTYDLNKNPLSFTDLLGNTTTYLTQGTFKGLKDRDILSTGQTFIYEYTKNTDLSISVQKRELHQQVYNYTTLDGQTTLLSSSNPYLFLNARFENDNSFDPQINITATGTGKNLALKLVSGSTGSSYTFNGVTTALNVSINKGTTYTVEIRWETGRIGIYVYPQGGTRPATPQGAISDRSWDVKFKAVSQNAYLSNPWDPSYNYTARGTFNNNFSTNAQSFVYLSGTPAERINFNQNGSYRNITLKVKQNQGGIYRTITLYWYNNSWSAGVSDWNSLTNVTTNTNSTVAQTLVTGTDYTADLRIEGTKLNVYVYLKGTDRPQTPTISLASLAAMAEFEATFSNATGKAEEYKNLTTPVYSASAFQAKAATTRIDTVKSLTITKPPAPTVNPTDYSSITYGSDSKLKQIIKTDNTKYIFLNGLLTQVLDSAGNPTNFNFTQSTFSNITGSEIIQNGLDSQYDASGNLSQVKVNDLTLHYQSGTIPVYFDGNVDYLSTPDSSDFDFSGGVWTVDFWIRPTALTTNHLLWGQFTDGNNYMVCYVNSAGSVVFTVVSGGVNIITAQTTGPAVVVNAWQHIAIVEDGNNWHILVNGADQISSGQINTNRPANYTGGFSIAGPVPPISFPYFKGYMDQFRVSKGIARWTSNFTPLPTPYKVDSNTVLLLEPTSTGKWIDGSFSSHEVNVSGNPFLDSTQRHFGFQDSNSTLPTNQIDYIEKTDKTQLHNLVFDTTGNVIGAEITAPGGEVRTYQAGKLVDLRRPDNSEIVYQNDKPFKLMTPEKLAYNFDYTAPNIVQAVLDPSIVPQDATTPVKMQYDTSFNLTKVIRQNNQVLNYLNNTLTQIDIPSSASQVFSYQRDSGGNILSSTVTQGNVATTYDLNNNPTSAVISPTTDNLHTLLVSYQYGKIRQITRDGVLAFTYTYSFDSNNNELTNIEDLLGNTSKVYQGGNLLTSLDKTNSLLSSYSYVNNQVSQVLVSRLGRTLHTYNYSYSGDMTVVADEEGTIRTYDKDKKLAFLEKDGQKFQYTYTTVTTQTQTVPQETVLPVTTFGTSARSTGTQSWQQWVTNTTEGSLGIASWGWVKYDTTLSQAGDLKIGFDSTNFSGALPSGYQFNLDIAIDGVVKTHYTTPVVGAGWNTNQVTLTGLSQGAHSVTITWTNDYYVANQYDANFKFRNLKFTQITAALQPQTEIITSEELIEKKLSDGSVARYTGGQLTSILKTDGTVISDLTMVSNAVLDPQTVISQEYSADGTLQTQTKADGTVTLFDNNKPSEVLDSKGVILIQYSYDADWNPSRVYLKNARDTLPEEVLKAKQSIEQQRASSLQALAAQKNLAYQSIQTQVATQRQTLQQNLNDLQNQYNQVANTRASGRRARSQRGDVLNQIGVQMDQVRGALATSYQQEADAYAGLDSQVKSASDKIEADSQSAYTSLATQESNMKQEILRQEVSPIVYDYYRRILGRDPSSAEYSSWISQVDYNSGLRAPEASVSFDGNGDYLSMADSNDFDLSGGLWTVDTWIKVNNLSANQTIFSQSNDVNNYVRAMVMTDGSIRFNTDRASAWTVTLQTNSGAIVANTWYHLAIQQSAGIYTLFLNGKNLLSVTNANNADNFTGTFNVGSWAYSSEYFNGWIDDLRISKGVARYSANFTPATAPSAVDANTTFLLRNKSGNALSFNDDVNPSRVITAYGNASVDVTQTTFTQPATLATPVKTLTGQELPTALKNFLLSLPELTDRQTYVQTIKNAVTSAINSYLAMTQANQQSFAASIGLSPSDIINLTSSDAQKILTWLNSRLLHFGQSAFLSLESLLDQKGISYTRTDLAQKCILIDFLTGVISPLDDGDLVISMFALNKVAGLYGLSLNGANLSWDDLKSVYDANKAIIDTVTTTTTVPGSSINFNGSGSYLSIPSSDDWNFGTGDWTVEGWFNWTTVQNSMSFNRGPNDFSVEYYNNALYISHPALDTTIRSFTPTPGVWYHLAFERINGNERIYVNGAQQGADVANSHDITFSDSVYIGSYQSISNFFSGRMDGLRVSKGIGRYNQNFTPNTQRFTADSYTKLLLYSDSQTGIKDLSSAPHSITVNGGAVVDTSAYAQSTQQTTTTKVITRYPSTISNPSTLTAAQKQDIIDHPENYNPRVVALINSSHYVIITNVTADLVTYLDTGAGPDKNNQSFTISKADFLKIWKGNVTLDTSLVQPVLQKTTTASKLLSADQTKTLRGACWFIFVAIYFAVVNVGAAVWAVANAIGTIIAAVGTLVGNVLTAIGQALSTLGQGLSYIGHSLFEGIKLAASTVFDAGKQLFGSFLQQSVVGGGTQASFGNVLFQTAVRTGLSYATTKGLESLGVNPTIASLASAFVTGGFQGLTSPISAAQAAEGVTRATMIASSVFQSVSLQGIGQLGIHLGLDPNLTNIVSLSVAAIGGQVIQNPTTTLQLAFSKVQNQIVSSLAQYGVNKLGTSLGLDPRVSSLIGTPVSAALNVGLQASGATGAQIINAVNDGIVRGAVSLGISYATQSISNPLLASLTSRAVTGAIDGALGGNVFQGIYDAFTKSALNVTRLGISGDDAWSQAQYLQRVINFSTIIQQKGLAQAIEDSATQIFTEDSINSILKSYSSVKNYIQDAINQNKFQRIQIGSNFFRRLTLSNRDSITASDNYSDLTRIQKGSEIIDATYGGSFGKVGDVFGAIAADHQATIGDQFNSYILFEKIQNGQQAYAEVKDSTGKTVLIIEPSGTDHYNVYNSYGNYVNAKISNPIDNKEYQISSGMLDSYHVLSASGSQVVWGMDLVGGLYLKTYQNLNLTSNEQSLTQPQKSTLDQMMQDIQSVVKPLTFSTNPLPITYAGPLSGVAAKINSIDNPLVTSGLKQSAINALNNWLASNPGVIPDVKVVIRKTVVGEFDLLSLHYEHDNETTSTFKGNNDRITLKVDPFSGSLFEVGLDGTVRLIDSPTMNVDVGINTNINSNLISSSMDVLYRMDSKYNGNKIATTTTSLSYDPTGKTEFSYESGGTFSSDLEVQNNTVIKVSAPTRNLLLATAGAFSGALLAVEVPAASAVAAGTLAQVYQAIRTAMANGALGIS